MVTYCFNRVIFGLRPSPALLAVVIEKNMQTVDTPLSREILANCYVDNIYLTADDLEEAHAKYKESKHIFADMNMNLREFATNDPKFNQALPTEDRAHFDGFKQLGINWNLDTDVWIFDFKVGILDENWAPKPKKGRKKTSKETSQTSLRPTKRMMSSTMLSRFDPLRLVNLAILPARLSVQTACKEKYGWDDPVDSVLIDQWNKAVSCWTRTVIYVPRLIKPKTSELVDLHVFCDASGHSYGACAYLVVQHSDATRSAHLVFSRSRLKPLNANLTIPRLGLMAGVLGARLVDFLQKQLTVKAPRVTLHTYSQVVFFWIKSLEKQPVFVENRLKEIRALIDLHTIALRYVPSELNPADVLSRGIRADQLQDHDPWWHGPTFLKESDVSLWPSQPEVTEYEDADQSLEQMIEREIVMSTTARLSKLDYIVDPEEFNDWSKLLDQTCACLFRVVALLQSISVKRQTLSFVPAPLFPLVSDVTLFRPDNPTSLADLQATENLILRITQSQHLPTMEETRQLRQYPVLEKQLNIVVTRLRKVDGGYYPVVLHLRNREDQQTDVHADAIGIMRRVGMPKDYPIHCHYWTGGRTQYENWTSHFPNTLFGFNAGSFSRGLSPDQLDLLRTIPLDHVTFESDAPYHGKRGTSQTIGTPAGVVRAITQFKELGNRPESLQAIAQASMANVIRMYRPDLTVIIEQADEDVARESQTSPSDQTNHIGPNTTTMFEHASICDAGCDGLHRQCSDVFLVKGPDDEGLVLSNRARAVTDIHITTNLRNVRVTSFVHLVLCLWGGRLLQDRLQDMVQFFEELQGDTPDQSSAVLSRWYNRITGGSSRKFRAIQESDVRLALRKRFHACSLGRSWMQTSSPPFQYESHRTRPSILRFMPEALSWTYDQFVRTTVTVGQDDPDQPGPSRQAQRQTSSQRTSLTRETTGTSGQEQHRRRQQKRPRRDEDE